MPTRGFGDNQPEKSPGNWIAISRDIQHHPIVGFGHPIKPADPKRGAYSRNEAWQFLLFRAEFKRKRVTNGGRVIWLERGEMIGGIAWFAERWNWSRATVRWFLQQLENDMMIVCRNTNSDAGVKARLNDPLTRIVSVCKYNKYQLAQDLEDLLNTNSTTTTTATTTATTATTATTTATTTTAPTQHQPKTQTDQRFMELGDTSNTRSTTTATTTTTPTTTTTATTTQQPPLSKKEETIKQKKEPPFSPPKGQIQNRAHRLPEGWQPKSQTIQWARNGSIGASDHDIELQLEHFRDHALANGKRFVDWDRAFQTWMRNAKEWGRFKGSPRNEDRKPDDMPDHIWAKIQAQKNGGPR